MPGLQPLEIHLSRPPDGSGDLDERPPPSLREKALMVRKPSAHPVASLLNALETWFARPQRQTSAIRSPQGRARRLGYESLEGRVVMSANPGAVIQGEVFNDLTGHGQTSDGPGLAAVTVNLFRDGGDGKFEGTAIGSDDTLVGTQQTNSSGGYSFGGLTAGTYFVQEVVPTGYLLPAGVSAVDTIVVSNTTVLGTPGPSVDSFTTTQQVVASSLTTSSSALAVAAPEAIGGYRAEAVQLTSTSGEVNLYTNLYTPDVLEYDSSSTAIGSGTVIWDGNTVANPTVLNPTGLNHADLTGGGLSTGITLDIGADADPTSITLTVYKDAGDWSTVTEAVPDTGGTATQPLYIPFSSFTVGGGTGAGSFNNVGAIQLQITGDSGAHAQISSIGAVGPTHLNANFANYQPASVGSFAFWDLNTDGVRDNAETGAANVAVQLLQNGSVVTTTTTNAQGNYSFTGLAPGAYSVKFIPANGTLFTTEGVGNNPAVNSDVNPATGTSPVFNLTSGENDSSVDAGLLPIELSIVKSVNNSTPVVGTNVNFTITLSNATGVSPATGVAVSDVLPAGLTFVSATPAQGTYSSSTGVWAVGNLASGASTSLIITATVIGTSTITNNVQVASADESDNSPPSSLQSSASLTPVQPAALELTKTVNNATPNVGQNVVFTQTLTNLGPGVATDVTTTDVLPAGLTFVSSTANEGSYNSTTGVWTVGTVANGSTATLQMTATVTTPGTKTNTATISHVDQPDPNPNNTGIAIVTPQQADLSVTKTVNNSTPIVGQNATFTITVSNSGPSTATGVVTTDVLPAGLTFVSDTASQGSYNSTTGLWTIGTLPSGAAPVTLTLIANVATAGAKTNTATVTGGQYDPNLSNNTASATVTPSAQVDLTLTKTVDNPIPTVGTIVHFTITVSNAVNESTATDVIVHDLLPAGLTFVSATPAQGIYSAGTGVWTVGSLASGATTSLVIAATVTTTGVKTNVATVTTDQPDPNGGTPATATVNPLPPVTPPLVIPAPAPTPSIAVRLSKAFFLSHYTG